MSNGKHTTVSMIRTYKYVSKLMFCANSRVSFFVQNVISAFSVIGACTNFLQAVQNNFNKDFSTYDDTESFVSAL